MPEREIDQREEWPLRPWLLAAIGAVAGLLFHSFTDFRYSEPAPVMRQAAATFVAVSTLAFILTVERRRWPWSVAFAAGWGLVVALVGWFTASYNLRPTIFEWPFLSGLFAVMLAAPLFQTVRDEGAWRFPYPQLHRHAWLDAVIGAASLGFTGVTFLMVMLIGTLFDLIGIGFLRELLNKEWFDWMLAGAAFGGAAGLLRERDALLATLQRLAMTVLSVLAPVLAVALVLFVVSLPFTGLGKLWDSRVPATPTLLAAGAFAILLANAVIGDGREERSRSGVLGASAMALVAVVLPLAFVAALSLGQRIGQHGWTPERLWGAIAILVAMTYGACGWWALFRGRGDFDDVLRPLQTKLAIGLCGLALFLALPILDFGRISAGSQIERLENRKVPPSRFDWAAMAFDFGPAGRERLAEIARRGPLEWRTFAKEALASKDRWQTAEATRIADLAETNLGTLRPMSPDIVIDDDLKRRIARRAQCPRDATCTLVKVDDRRIAVVSIMRESGRASANIIDLSQPVQSYDTSSETSKPVEGVDANTARIEIREETRRRVYVNGEPVGEIFE